MALTGGTAWRSVPMSAANSPTLMSAKGSHSMPEMPVRKAPAPSCSTTAAQPSLVYCWKSLS
eukprot:994193-Pyramimonas_sp.AAC.1